MTRRIFRSVVISALLAATLAAALIVLSLFGIYEGIAVDRVELQLMPTTLKKESNKGGNLFFTERIAEDCVVQLHRQGTSVDDLFQIVFCEGGNG